MLKKNPEMVKKVSKCVNSIFENKDLMSSLVSEIEINVSQGDQTLVNNAEGLHSDAVLNESKQ